jgi:competence protein ComEA
MALNVNVFEWSTCPKDRPLNGGINSERCVGATRFHSTVQQLTRTCMFKKFFAFLAAMSLMAAFAAVDINKGSEAELQTIKGIGAAKSKLIVEERKKGEFKNWEDFIARVKGFGQASATKLSAEGLTVGGAGYKPAAKDSKAAAKDTKPAAAAAPKADAKPAAAPAAAPAAKPEAPKK